MIFSHLTMARWKLTPQMTAVCWSQVVEWGSRGFGSNDWKLVIQAEVVNSGYKSGLEMESMDHPDLAWFWHGNSKAMSLVAGSGTD